MRRARLRRRRGKIVRFVRRVKNADRERSVIRMPAWRRRADPVCMRNASRILHLESNRVMHAPWCSATATPKCG